MVGRRRRRPDPRTWSPVRLPTGHAARLSSLLRPPVALHRRPSLPSLDMARRHPEASVVCGAPWRAATRGRRGAPWQGGGRPRGGESHGATMASSLSGGGLLELRREAGQRGVAAAVGRTCEGQRGPASGSLPHRPYRALFAGRAAIRGYSVQVHYFVFTVPNFVFLTKI